MEYNFIKKIGVGNFSWREDLHQTRRDIKNYLAKGTIGVLIGVGTLTGGGELYYQVKKFHHEYMNTTRFYNDYTKIELLRMDLRDLKIEQNLRTSFVVQDIAKTYNTSSDVLLQAVDEYSNLLQAMSYENRQTYESNKEQRRQIIDNLFGYNDGEEQKFSLVRRLLKRFK